MRKLLIVAVAIGIIAGIAVCASYGWDQATALKDRVTQAFFYGFVAFAAIILHAMAIRIWVWGWRRCAVFVGVIAFLGFVATALTSFGGLASRNDTVIAERQDAIDTRADTKKQITDLIKEKSGLVFRRTTKEGIGTAERAADAATRARARECGTRQVDRGPLCRHKEDAEATALKALAKAQDNKAATDRFDQIEAELKRLRGDRTTGVGVGNVDPLRALLTTMVGGWADLVTSWWKAAFVVIYDLSLIGMMVAIEALGHASPAAAPAAPEPEPKPRRLDRLFARWRKPKSASDPAPSAPEPPAPAPQDRAPEPPLVRNLPERPRPRLAATTNQPIGPVLDWLHDGIDFVAGARTKMTDAFMNYQSWCRRKERRALSVEGFVRDLEVRCRELGIRIASDGDNHYLLDVKLISLDHVHVIVPSTSDVDR